MKKCEVYAATNTRSKSVTININKDVFNGLFHKNTTIFVEPTEGGLFVSHDPQELGQPLQRKCTDHGGDYVSFAICSDYIDIVAPTRFPEKAELTFMPDEDGELFFIGIDPEKFLSSRKEPAPLSKPMPKLPKPALEPNVDLVLELVKSGLSAADIIELKNSGLI